MDLSVCFPKEQPRLDFRELVICILQDVAPEEVFHFEAMNNMPYDVVAASHRTSDGRTTRGLPGMIEMGGVSSTCDGNLGRHRELLSTQGTLRSPRRGARHDASVATSLDP